MNREKQDRFSTPQKPARVPRDAPALHSEHGSKRRRKLVLSDEMDVDDPDLSKSQDVSLMEIDHGEHDRELPLRAIYSQKLKELLGFKDASLLLEGMVNFAQAFEKDYDKAMASLDKHALAKELKQPRDWPNQCLQELWLHRQKVADAKLGPVTALLECVADKGLAAQYGQLIVSHSKILYQASKDPLKRAVQPAQEPQPNLLTIVQYAGLCWQAASNQYGFFDANLGEKAMRYGNANSALLMQGHYKQILDSPTLVEESVLTKLSLMIAQLIRLHGRPGYAIGVVLIFYGIANSWQAQKPLIKIHQENAEASLNLISGAFAEEKQGQADGSKNMYGISFADMVGKHSTTVFSFLHSPLPRGNSSEQRKNLTTITTSAYQCMGISFSAE